MLIYYDKCRLNAALCIFKKTPEQALLFFFCKRDLHQTYGCLETKLIGVSFIQIAQTVRELVMCFDPPTQRGQTIGICYNTPRSAVADLQYAPSRIITVNQLQHSWGCNNRLIADWRGRN